MFYTYIHYSQNNKPIYVGKGKGKRAYHPRDYGEPYTVKIVHDNIPEAQALEFEEFLIQEIGIDNLYNKLRKGENLSETEVAAIKAKDPNARPRDFRVILPDGKLAGLLNYNPASATEEMTYFRLPQYLKDHFISEAKVVA